MADAPTATPSAAPKATAMPKPTRVVISVWLALSQMPGQYCMRAPIDSLGDGKMKAGMSKSRHAASQIRKKLIVAIHGLALKRKRRQIMRCPSRARYGSEGHGRNR